MSALRATGMSYFFQKAGLLAERSDRIQTTRAIRPSHDADDDGSVIVAPRSGPGIRMTDGLHPPITNRSTHHSCGTAQDSHLLPS